MVALILAIASSALVSLIMRVSETRVQNRTSMLAMNYVMCTLLAASFAMKEGLLPSGAGSSVTWLLGAAGGVLYLGSFLLLQWNIRVNGVTLPATFMKLGVLVPTLLSIFAFGEMPSAMQAAGVVLAVLAIVMIKLEKGGDRAKNGFGLIALLLGGGAADALIKVFEELGPAAQKDHFLMITFGAAFVLCALLCLHRGERLTAVDAGFGLLIGVPNYCSSLFLMHSLSSVPAVIAYPTYSVATIVVLTAAGRLLFAERLSRRQMAALLVILLALAMLNL